MFLFYVGFRNDERKMYENNLPELIHYEDWQINPTHKHVFLLIFNILLCGWWKLDGIYMIFYFANYQRTHLRGKYSAFIVLYKCAL